MRALLFMTALVIATDIPSSINTVEKLAVWSANVLFNLNSGVTAVEGDNYTQRAAQSGNFYIAATDLTRHVARQSIELDAAYSIGAAKPWAYAKELSQKPLTADMKAN
jgi:hypothetical protein